MTTESVLEPAPAWPTPDEQPVPPRPAHRSPAFFRLTKRRPESPSKGGWNPRCVAMMRGVLHGWKVLLESWRRMGTA